MEQSLINKVHNKLYQEYDEYIKNIEKMPSKQIIPFADSIAIKQKLVDMFYERGRVSKRTLEALLEMPNTLDCLCGCWEEVEDNIQDTFYETIEEECEKYVEEYIEEKKLNVEKREDVNLYADISAACWSLNYFFLCEELKEKYDIKKFDVVDIDIIFKNKNGKKDIYNFFNKIINDDKLKKLLEKNANVTENLENIQNNILPKLKGIIMKESNQVKKDYER